MAAGLPPSLCELRRDKPTTLLTGLAGGLLPFAVTGSLFQVPRSPAYPLQRQEVFEQLVADVGEEALGVELHTFGWVGFGADAHKLFLIG